MEQTDPPEKVASNDQLGPALFLRVALCATDVQALTAWQVALIDAERERLATLADGMRIGQPGHTAPHPVFLYRGDVGAAIRGPNVELTGRPVPK